jgi:hypothetical protein
MLMKGILDIRICIHFFTVQVLNNQFYFAKNFEGEYFGGGKFSGLLKHVLGGL